MSRGEYGIVPSKCPRERSRQLPDYLFHTRYGSPVTDSIRQGLAHSDDGQMSHVVVWTGVRSAKHPRQKEKRAELLFRPSAKSKFGALGVRLFFRHISNHG